MRVNLWVLYGVANVVTCLNKMREKHLWKSVAFSEIEDSWHAALLK